MDFTPIIAQVWGTLGWFIPLMLLIGLLKSPWAKGHIGELLVRLFAHFQLDKQVYRRLHNVTLNTPDGTTQIDHVPSPPTASMYKTSSAVAIRQPNDNARNAEARC
jgi:restriction system protein